MVDEQLTEELTEELTGYEIAVIGMDGRFPGAADIGEFWDNLKNGRDCITFFSREELVGSGVPGDVSDNPNYVGARGMLGGVECFDSDFFEYTALEADLMDPQLRVLHECCWKALEDAGINPEDEGRTTGFYVGASTHFYWIGRMMGRLGNPSEQFGMVAVNDGYSISTQVAYRLNLRGPAVTVQTACSTSLTAIHMACQALNSGECDTALAGGVTVKLPSRSGYMYQPGMVNSPDGCCRAFDAKGAGTVISEGVGIVVLKPLEEALKDNDHIYAVVKGSAINNDGNRRMGYSAPGVKGQTEVIRVALQAAEVEPESISYVEAHGTATPLGDPVEIRALTRAFGYDQDKTGNKQYCRIGSVKTNIGHLDAAAGAAGFVKTVLSLYHRQIPASLHFEKPNPEIDFENSPFMVNTGLHEWKRGATPLRAGVSSFGIGGTNAHVILEEAPARHNMPPAARGSFEKPPLDPAKLFDSSCSELQAKALGAGAAAHGPLLISGRTPGALERNTRNLGVFLESHSEISFGDVFYTLQKGRKSFEYRRFLVCDNPGRAAAILADNPGESKSVLTARVSAENPQVVFLFSGLGSQYVNMGYGLYNEEPVFREEADRCFNILEPLLGYDLKTKLYPGDGGVDSSLITDPGISQPVIFLFQYSLAKLLMSWGIRPHAMIGYSFGEYTAACISGVLELNDALSLVVHRGQLVARTVAGAMLVVPLESGELPPLRTEAGEVYLAVDNGGSCIISGSIDAVAAFEKTLKSQKVLSMRLNAPHALHSPLMVPILDEMKIKLGNISFGEPNIPYVSNVTGRWITASESADPEYWCRHLSGTVRFSDGIGQLLQEPQAFFLELGPGRDLSTMIRRRLGEQQGLVNLVRPREKQTADTAYLADRVGRLWQWGCRLDWRAYHGNTPRFTVPLPTYSFEPNMFQLNDSPMPEPSHQQSQAPLMKSFAGSRGGFSKEPLAAGGKRLPRDEVEEEIVSAFCDIFGVENIGIDDDFFELGGDSLKVITLVTMIHERLEVEVPMEVVFRNPTVEALAGYVGAEARKRIYAPVPPAEKREYYPMSSPQKRVFILEQIEESGMAYNMPNVTWMEGNLDPERLCDVYRQLIQRHESLRTGFFLHDGEPVQRVFDHLDFAVDYREAGEEDIEDLIAAFIRPFDLSQPPLWRVSLIKTAEQKYLLMDMMHHIVSDDLSIGVLMFELSYLYAGKELKPLPTQYKDYVLWHEGVTAADDTLEKQGAFWLDHFADAAHLPRPELPYDFPRPEMQSFAGDHIFSTIDLGFRNQLMDLARQNKTTLFMVLFSVYNTLLYTYSGCRDIVVGIPVTGRFHRDVEDLVGMFVNTLALRNRPTPDKTFETFLAEVKEENLAAFSNRFYQFEDLVDRLDLPRDLARNPLFDTMFVLHTVNVENIDLPGINMRSYGQDHPAARFDITMNTSEFSGGVRIMLEYCTAIFKRETMEAFVKDFLHIARKVVENPRIRLGDIDVTPPPGRAGEDRKRILEEFNNTTADYPADIPVHGLIARQAELNPDRVALIGLNHHDDTEGPGRFSKKRLNRLTYRELDNQAGRRAGQLHEKGVRPGDITGIMAGRTVELMIGIIAILKTGAAYLPIDPDYPKKRINYMLTDSAAELLMPPAAKGGFFEKPPPLDPPLKNFSLGKAWICFPLLM